jgi:hypothetical protein
MTREAWPRTGQRTIRGRRAILARRGRMDPNFGRRRAM